MTKDLQSRRVEVGSSLTKGHAFSHFEGVSLYTTRIPGLVGYVRAVCVCHWKSSARPRKVFAVDLFKEHLIAKGVKR